jgi:hypothetical protein
MDGIVSGELKWALISDDILSPENILKEEVLDYVYLVQIKELDEIYVIFKDGKLYLEGIDESGCDRCYVSPFKTKKEAVAMLQYFADNYYQNLMKTNTPELTILSILWETKSYKLSIPKCLMNHIDNLKRNIKAEEIASEIEKRKLEIKQLESKMELPDNFKELLMERSKNK